MGQKTAHQTRGHNSVKSYPNQLSVFFLQAFSGTIAVKRLLWIPAHLACVGTLRCENI